MFDETQANQTSPAADLPPTNQPPVSPRPKMAAAGTEDIFADIDKVGERSATMPRPTKMSAPAGPPEPLTQLPDDLEEEAGGGKKFLMVMVAAVVVGLLGVGGYFVYAKFFKSGGLNLPFLNLNQPSTTNLNEESATQNQNLNQPADANVNQPANSNVNQVVILDSDKDGLTDDEEKTYGTDINEADSDGDGLFDKEEVKIYNTNPLDPDSDSDGYIDGDEVKNGYNPNGSGRLLDLNFE